MRFGKKPQAEEHVNIIEKIITDIVNNLQGCKLMELITEISSIILNENRTTINLNHDDYMDLINLNSMSNSEKVQFVIDTVNEMISKGKLVGLGYTLDKGNYHDKMFLLPKGSSFKYRSKNRELTNE